MFLHNIMLLPDASYYVLGTDLLIYKYQSHIVNPVHQISSDFRKLTIRIF